MLTRKKSTTKNKKKVFNHMCVIILHYLIYLLFMHSFTVMVTSTYQDHKVK